MTPFNVIFSNSLQSENFESIHFEFIKEWLSHKDKYIITNGRDIKLKYPIRSGRELAKNLIRPGWFQKCNKYYVVSQSIVAQGAVVPEDGFTVSMIIEDDEL